MAWVVPAISTNPAATPSVGHDFDNRTSSTLDKNQTAVALNFVGFTSFIAESLLYSNLIVHFTVTTIRKVSRNPTDQAHALVLLLTRPSTQPSSTISDSGIRQDPTDRMATELEEQTYPEILRCNLESTVLELMSMGISVRANAPAPVIQGQY